MSNQTPSLADRRHVAVFGPTGSGKSTVIAALATAATKDGGTAESWHGASGLSVTAVTHRGSSITLVETTGADRHIGALRAALRAADAALFVLGSCDGIDPSTILLWHECGALGLARLVLITKLDDDASDFDETVAICARVLGDGVHAAALPMHDDEGYVAGYVDLLTERIWEISNSVATERDLDPEHVPLIAESRDELVMALAQEFTDESLVTAYLAHDPLSTEALTGELHDQIRTATIFPILPATVGVRAVGFEAVLDLIVDGFPPPAQALSRPSSDAPVLAQSEALGEVLAISESAATVALARLTSGSVRAGDQIWLSRRSIDGEDRRPITITEVGRVGGPTATGSEAVTGDLTVITTTDPLIAGAAFANHSNPPSWPEWGLPQPTVTVRIVGGESPDLVTAALVEAANADPTLRVHVDNSGGLTVTGVNDEHIEAVLQRIRKATGDQVEVIAPLPRLRDTVRAAVSGEAADFTSGPGGSLVVTLEPLARGGVDVVFDPRLSADVETRIETAVRGLLDDGLSAGLPVVDVRVVVSASAEFVAGAGGERIEPVVTELRALLGQLLERAELVTLEPASEVAIECDDEYADSVRSDLRNRRGKVLHTAKADGGRTQLAAIAPTSELLRYAGDLVGLTHGSGTFTTTPSGFLPVRQPMKTMLTLL